MKNSILYFLFISVAFWSCENKDDSVFEKTADERLNEALGAYEKQLTEATYGWNAVIYPGNGGSYGLYMKFNDQNRVTMYSDFKEESAANAKESSYRLKAMQTPTLIFDTYGYLHVLADPDADVNGGSDGVGLASDFEFAIYPDSVTADRIVFTGRKNASKLVLTRATQAQQTAYNNGAQATALAFHNLSKYKVYFKRLTINGVAYEITVGQDNRMLKMTWMEGTAVKNFNTTYYFTSEGLVFRNPLVNGSNTIGGFNNISWDESKTQVSVSVNGATSVIGTATRPLSIDRNAARTWHNAPVATGGEWRSVAGFHINGLDNALGVDKLTSDGSPYIVYIFIPGGPNYYDLFAPTFLVDNALDFPYYNVISSTFPTDGRVIFSEVRTAGTNPPVSGPFVETKKILLETSGYYLIQTSEKTYDMVSAKDATTWINWFRP
jgi:hypothetical protein